MQTSEQLERFSLELKERADSFGLWEMVGRPDGRPAPTLDPAEVYGWLANCLKQLADLTAIIEQFYRSSAPPGLQAEMEEEMAERQPAQAVPGALSAATTPNMVQSSPPPARMTTEQMADTPPIERVDDAEIDPNAQVIEDARVAPRDTSGFAPMTPEQIAALESQLPPACPECGIRGGHRTGCSYLRAAVPPLQ